MNSKSIMIVGVGGQGTLLAGRIIGNAALAAGYDVKVSEVHGMSQRGGSVVTYVKYGESISSPVICRGEADIILAFEQMEALRWSPYLKNDGLLITSNQMINPMPVITGAAHYNENIIEKLTATGIRIETLDAAGIAQAVGNDKASNIAIIGALAGHIENDGITREILTDTITAYLPQKHLKTNLEAFEMAQCR
ncbi:MAG: indolepyruvate oxidoreductase subunit beta [Clostridiales bacterium]|nr:indolepyruvate oxidoreductase subunit beta [Clostridiales bacterium]MDR2713123.1 indolepyruvate oxidoreductase subunit beta [Clostridiales bacterium]